MRRPSYTVHLTTQPDPIPVTVLHTDQLVAEMTAPRLGLPVMPDEAPLHMTTLYVWCALRRMGLNPGEWQEFKTQTLIGFEAVRDPDTGEEGTALDPTQPGHGTESP